MKLQKLPDNLVLGTSVVALASTLIYYWFKSRNKHTKPNYLQVSVVEKLFIYPIKSLKGVEVDHLQVTENVLKYGKYLDRSWMLLSGKNELIKLRLAPKLALASVSFHNENEVWVDAPNMHTLKLKPIDTLNANHNIITFKLYGTPMKGVDCGEQANKWFQQFLEEEGAKLVQYHPQLGCRPTNSEKRRNDDDKFPIIYQDYSGVHLVNENSVRDLNSRLDTDNQVTYANFRPNIIVDGVDAYIEDKWKHMSINEVEFLQLFYCDRCLSTDVNTQTGKKDLKTVKSLREFRPKGTQKKGLGPPFGSIFGSLSQGVIRVNDAVKVSYGDVPF